MNRSLLETIRGLLERTYRIHSGLGELAPFIIGDRGYERIYGSSDTVSNIGSGSGNGARMLIRETAGGIRATVYFPDELIETLERYPPQHGLGVENIDAFATFVEEIDHLLSVADRSRRNRSVSLFELELHANVSKNLVCERFLAGRRSRLDVHERLWLRHRLFDRGTFCDPDPGVRARYRDALHWSVRMLDRIKSLEPTATLRTLRRFHELGSGGKLELIRSLPQSAI